MGDSWIVPVKIAIFTAKVDLLPMVASGISSHAAMPFFSTSGAIAADLQ